jgi:hypothetical protein
MRQLIPQRIRFFLAVEGESEQSFVTWLYILSAEKNLPIHLDTFPLGGGGFKSMLAKAVREHARRSRNKGTYKNRFLIVDEDRIEHGDWSIERLRQEAARHAMTVCVQRPNHEGLLYRMKRGFEREFLAASLAETKLRTHWPTYQKAANAQKLQSRYSLDDLMRAANFDPDLETLLRAIGLLISS